MNCQEVYKINLDTEDTDLIARFDEPVILASYLASLPADELWQYEVTDWIEEDDQETMRADEWLEWWIGNMSSEGEDCLYTVGTKVIIPPSFKTKKNQKRFCVIDAFKPEKGREYVILRGITRQGISKSPNQVFYCKLKYLHRLKIVSRFSRYTSITPE